MLVLLIVVCAVAKLAGPDARAAEAPVTVSFTEVGAHTFMVPAGVTSIHVVAVGAPGAAGEEAPGGAGGVATADVAVTPGQTLGVYVGGPGQSTAGGFNGGGGGAERTGGGGGASDVRSGADLGSRQVIAGGGGGGGGDRAQGSDPPTAGGVAGESAKSNSECGGGGAGTVKGGAGGKGTTPGGSGSLGQGGAGGAGGGGGGLYGGGSGGNYRNAIAEDSVGCGGGGGSSGFGPGTASTSVAISESSTSSVTITYTVAPAPPTPPSGTGTGTGTGGGNGPAGGATKANLSLPVVQHGKAIVGTVQIPANRSTLKAKLLWQKTKKKQLVFGSLNEGALKKGLHSFTVNLNGRGKGKLARLGSLKLTLSISVIPPQGAVAKAAKRVTLKP
jgi:hypothetical protein